MADWNLLALDEDARDLAETARAQFRTLPGPAAAREAIDRANGAPVGSDAWPALVAGGYLDIAVPDELGGLGRMIDLVVVLEEAGRSLLTAPLLPAVLAYQTQVAAGLHRPEDRSAPAGFVVASGTVEDGRCFADRGHAFGGAGAATLTAVVRGPDRAWVVTIDAAADGVELQQTETIIDPSRPAPALRLRGAPCRDSRLVALDAVDRILAPARVCLAADLVGLATGALDAAVEHALQRQQFGGLIGSFQAVKHQLADAYLAVERARSLTYGAAVELRSVPGEPEIGGPPDLSTRDSLLAYATAAETAVQVASRYIQLLGAMGVTFEADGHLYLRRAHQTVALFGPPDDLYLAVARVERARTEKAAVERTVGR